MTKAKRIVWNEENTNKLTGLVGAIESGEVSRETVESVADEFGTSSRSIGNKLRNLGYTVQKAAEKASLWSEAQEAQLTSVLEGNSQKYTYAELETVLDMGFTAKQIQGKVLSMELFSHVRKAEPKAAKRDYTPEQDASFVQMCKSGATIEDLVEHFGKSAARIRGKALSFLRTKEIDAMPTQKTSTAKAQKDALEGLDVANMAVEDIAEQSGHSVRGIKSMLSRRGITAANYDGAAKRAKLDAAAKED